jgi:eukaryotic-like serine/threonine-protein kinase
MLALTQGISRIDGKYRVLAQLGQGGTADVSLAVARGPSGFNKLVVLKSMKFSLRHEAELARMFLNEARLAARLNHPNIVQTNEVFEYEGLPVIVMEYLEGQPLSSVISRSRGSGRFSLAMHLRVISEALSGLHYSHELSDFDGTALQVVHRDMSPHNVFITFDGQVKILDFGIAKLASSQHHTATGVIKGKIHYMPPEQIAGEGVDRRSDLWAVGVMLWEAVAKRSMWQDEHDATVMNRILNAEIPRLREVADVDPELERIVEWTLQNEAAARPASAQELQTALDAVIAERFEAVLPRDLGKVTGELFEDTRQRTRRQVELQLARVPSLSAADYAATAPLELTAVSNTGYTAGSRSEPVDLSPARNRRLGWVAAVLLLAVTVVGFMLLQRVQSATLNATRASAAAPAAAAPAAMQLRITAFPAHARLTIDDQIVASNPYLREFSAADSGKRLRIRADAPQHRPEIRELVLSGDTDLVLLLEREVPAAAPVESAPAPGRAPRLNSPPPRQARPATSAAADCTPPWFLDAQGVKKFKTHCM